MSFIQSRAENPFQFCTSSLLIEITGKKASHLKEFVEILKDIDPSSIFFHMHHAFREYSFAPGQYSNDFSRWVADDLEEATLAERLASINVRDFNSLEALRDKIVEIIENHLKQAVDIRLSPKGREFYFLRNIGIVTKTKHEAWTLEEFAKNLKKVGMRSLYYHFFDARLRLGRKTNDFSNWISDSLGNHELAEQIETLDPYFMTMDQLRDKIISLCLGKNEMPGLNLKSVVEVVKRLAGK